MKSAVFQQPHSLAVENRPLPSVGPKDVLVRVAATGICAGDLYIYRGTNPYVSYPIVGGHEIAGVVELIGSEVTTIKPGDRVVVEPFLSCGVCYPCRIGKGNCCARLSVIGIHRDGGFAEFLAAPADRIHAVPANLSATVASFAEPVAIGLQAARRGQFSRHDTILVLGCGPIGLSIVEIARIGGAKVLALDVQEDRLEVARSFGAECFLAEPDVEARLFAMTEGEGFPVVVEAAGKAPAMEQACRLVAPGGRVVIMGVLNNGVEVRMEGINLIRKEMTILGSRASVGCFPEALDLLSKGMITYPQIATSFSMWDAPQLFADFTAHPGAVHKGVLKTGVADWTV